MVYETHEMLQKKLSLSKGDTAERQVLHWFVVTDGHRLAIVAFPNKRHQKITFGTVIRLLSFTVHPVNTVQLLGYTSLLGPFLSCCLNCTNLSLYFIKKKTTALPPLGIVPKHECLSFLSVFYKLRKKSISMLTIFIIDTSNIYGESRRRSLLSGIILKVFPLCIKIEESTFCNITKTIHLINLTCDLFSKQHGVGHSETGISYLAQAMVLVIDVELLQDIYNILHEDEASITFEIFDQWIKRFHKMCFYLTLENVS
jgi:hypothetical protein